MLAMLRDLVAHKAYANAALLTVIGQHDAAASDVELRDLLEHVRLANRFWLLAVLGSPFAIEEEARPSSSFAHLVERYRRLESEEEAWLAAAAAADVERILEDAQIPGGRCSVGHAILQVCLHSHGHRAQCAKLLRRHGVVPPQTDFILWLASRPRGLSLP